MKHRTAVMYYLTASKDFLVMFNSMLNKFKIEKHPYGPIRLRILLKELLFIRPLGLSSGSYGRWFATSCTQSMFTTFLRYFPAFTSEYGSSSIEVDFTSHHFRHTLNTLLDEGGLSELLKTEWFGRTNPKETKTYQHASREKRALMLREDIKKDLVGGQLAEQIKIVPVRLQDTILKARIQAVHDVDTGICIHNFSQTPCERHLQCSADCKDYSGPKMIKVG